MEVSWQGPHLTGPAGPAGPTGSTGPQAPKAPQARRPSDPTDPARSSVCHTPHVPMLFEQAMNRSYHTQQHRSLSLSPHEDERCGSDEWHLRLTYPSCDVHVHVLRE